MSSERREANRGPNGNEGNADADVIAAVYRVLRERDERSALLPLLACADEGDSGWAAAHALELAPGEGEPVLVRLSKSSDISGFNAEMTLREWRAGDLRFP